MEIRRFFVSQSDVSQNSVLVRGDEFAHMTRVLRYKVGFKAIVCANDGLERLCVVRKIDKDFAELDVEEVKVADRKSVSLTLYAGLLKNNKLDFAIQKAVELGVDRVVPFVSANCAETKFFKERVQKIALEAAKQCGSAYLSEVGDLVTLQKMIGELGDYDDVLFAYEFERKCRISDCSPSGKRIALIIGSEGGFTQDEAAQIKDKGAISVSLGRRILRAETASIVGCALLLDKLGELDCD